MKLSLKSILIVSSTLFLAMIFAVQTGSAHVSEHAMNMKNPPRWQNLGARKINFRVERDEIRVTARDGRFTALKLKFVGAAVNMRRMVVHYGNGDVQEVLLKKNFPAGGSTRVIDLKGGRRVVKKVVFWYDSKNRAARRATVQLWGRK
ncbi:MAG: hypothetical protein AAFY71_03745 [Bacteroidota bacterium]